MEERRGKELTGTAELARAVILEGCSAAVSKQICEKKEKGRKRRVRIETRRTPSLYLFKLTALPQSWLQSSKKDSQRHLLFSSDLESDSPNANSSLDTRVLKNANEIVSKIRQSSRSLRVCWTGRVSESSKGRDDESVGALFDITARNEGSGQPKGDEGGKETRRQKLTSNSKI